MKLIIATFFVFILANQSSAQEAGTNARLAFEHWYCHSIIGFMPENKKRQLEQKSLKHAEIGIKYARSMFAEINKFGSKNQTDWDQNAPFIWSYYVNQGPSEDFIIGRLYEQTQNSAYDDINKNMDGTFIVDATLRQSAAINEYEKRNCKILR